MRGCMQIEPVDLPAAALLAMNDVAKAQTHNLLKLS